MKESDENRIESKCLKIECGIKNWNKVREFINLYFENLFSDVDIGNFMIACEEVYINISKYAYNGERGRVDIKCSYKFNKKEMCVEFIDSGVEFDPTQYTIDNINLPLEERKMGGLGIFIAKKTSDYMCYERVNNKNILKIIKRGKRSVNDE